MPAEPQRRERQMALRDSDGRIVPLKRDKAPGVDGQTVDQYEEHLHANLLDLETRLHRRSYRPQPSLRREIPKGNGKTRPLGIACVEDKTKLPRFGRFAARETARRGEGQRRERFQGVQFHV